MIDFIVKYWVEFAFGLVVAGGSYVVKRLWTMLKKERESKQLQVHNDLISDMKVIINDAIGPVQNELTVLRESVEKGDKEQELMKAGMLCLQGDYFKKKCKRYLENDHNITEEEYLHLCQEHDVYKSLGGNSNGDRLFALCQEKVKNTMCQPPQHQEDQ